MAPRTRSTTSSPIKKTVSSAIVPPETDHGLVKVLVAPRHISLDARILLLRHPNAGFAKQFIFCPRSGLFELRQTTVPSLDPRSIIFSPLDSTNKDDPTLTLKETTSFSDGFISKDAEVLTATPFDLAFVLLRTVAPLNVTTQKALFQPLDDLLDSPESNDKSLKFVLENGQALVVEAMSRICDTVNAGDEEMFRYNEEKVFKLIIEKAGRVAESGLPTSLEERFVTRVLEAPMLNVKREETTLSIITSQPRPAEATASSNDSFDSESTIASTVTSAVFSEVSTPDTVLTVLEDTIPANIKNLQRLRIAYNFIAASYLPSYVTARLATMITSETHTIDFRPLDEYLKHLEVLRAQAAASRSMSDFSRKRGLHDDEAAEERAEKKRREEDDEKRKKANESRGVRDLKKVNVSGMKKMSDFFVRKPVPVKTKT